MELFPDLRLLSERELEELMEDLRRQESRISEERRLLHSQIDALRAEYIARLRRLHADTGLAEVDVESLANSLVVDSVFGRRNRRKRAARPLA